VLDPLCWDEAAIVDDIEQGIVHRNHSHIMGDHCCDDVDKLAGVLAPTYDLRKHQYYWFTLGLITFLVFQKWDWKVMDAMGIRSNN
jgi:hypothetical protein